MVRASRPRGLGERLAAGEDRHAALAAAAGGRGVISAVPGKAFPSRLHDERVAALLGLWLAATFLTCFATGLYSHFAQHPLDIGFLSMPASPGWLYRVTQGVHVAAGIAAVPLLLAKLWTVYPLLHVFPPVRSPAHLVERLALIPLVAGSIFQLATGLANIARWYPWAFSFPSAHYWTSWMVIGGLVVHVGAKWTTTRRAIGREARAEPEPEGTGLSRRGFLMTVGLGAGALTLLTVGQTLRPLKEVALLAPRAPDIGPQGLPVNRTASGAAVIDLARDPDYAIVVDGKVGQELRLSLADLQNLPQRESEIAITCVEGWSAGARWGGVRLRDVLALAGAGQGAEVVVHSLQQRGSYRSSRLNVPHAQHPDTLLALRVNGEPLALDHGYPCRLISPNRPGVQQTKWISRLEVV